MNYYWHKVLHWDNLLLGENAVEEIAMEEIAVLGQIATRKHCRTGRIATLGEIAMLG